MRTIFLLVLSLHISGALTGQRVAVYDAFFLDSLIAQHGTIPVTSELRPMLDYYFGKLNEMELNDSIENNPFLSPYFEEQDASSTMDGLKIPGLIGKVGGLDVTNLAHGISQFMIERAKQELTVAFFNRFKKFSEKYPEFNVLFPATSDNLANLLSHSYPEMLPALRAGFLKDLDDVTFHLDDVLELPKYQTLLMNFPELKVTIRSIRLVNELQSGESHASDLLDKLANLEEWNDETGSNSFKNFGSSIKLANILSMSVRKADVHMISKTDTTQINDTLIVTNVNEVINFKESKRILTTTTFKKFKISERFGDGTVTRDSIKEDVVRTTTSIEKDRYTDAWISFNELKSLVQDTIAFQIYMGLVYEVVKQNKIQFVAGNDIISFHALMAAHQDDLFLFENKLTEFIELANKVDHALDTLKGKQHFRSALINDELFNYIDVSLDVIEYGISVGKLFSDKIDVDQYCAIARNTNELFRNVYRHEYTQAVSNAMDILDEVAFMVEENKNTILIQLQPSFKNESVFLKPYDKLTKEDHDKIERLRTTTTTPGTKILFEKYAALRNSKFSLASFSKVLTRTTKYGLFMANMVKAESPDEIASILDAAVLPVGSSSIKKHSDFNIAIQSYLGGFGNLNYDESDESAWAVPFGVIAPIGVAFSYGLSSFGSVSLFLPLLDIGAVVDYQLKGNVVPTASGIDTVEVTKDYKIRLGQIFSPGAYFIWGLPCNLPLSIGIGRQFGPGLGKIDEDVPVVNNPKWRSNVFLAVDIPLFNLVNTPKVQKRKVK